MCTVLLRFDPDHRIPVLLGAIRDEFVERPWDPPAAHWGGPAAGLWGGRDRTAGGTWLAVDPERPAVAALLNGIRRPVPEDGPRPTRGTLALDVLATDWVPTQDRVRDHDGFHLLRVTDTVAEIWSWDGETLEHRTIEPGPHIVVNLGLDSPDDPLVPHFSPLLAALPDPLLTPGTEGWVPWVDLLEGDGLEPDDPRALLVRRDIEGRQYGSTSASLVAFTPDGVRYDFALDPFDRDSWRRIL